MYVCVHGVASRGLALPSCEDEWCSVIRRALQRPALCVSKVPVINGGGRMKNEFIYGQVLGAGFIPTETSPHP
ncbi:uncharacterized [Tachysurus ichikawai]